jgi:hypothetical protein
MVAPESVADCTVSAETMKSEVAHK